MKRLLPLLLVLILTGCGSLIPKPVELFQKKVKEFPSPKAKELEVQREAASMAADKAQETLFYAAKENSSTNILAPAKDTADLTRAVSTAVGPPEKTYTGPVSNLVEKTDASVAHYNDRVDSFKNRNDDLAGKKIEDTGLFKVPYFVWLGGALLLGFLFLVLLGVGWTALKVYGMSNPLVGMATGGVESVASKGFRQIVTGAENFKEAVSKKFAPELSNQILELFRNHQMQAQDGDVQVHVQNITK